MSFSEAGKALMCLDILSLLNGFLYKCTQYTFILQPRIDLLGGTFESTQMKYVLTYNNTEQGTGMLVI